MDEGFLSRNLENKDFIEAFSQSLSTHTPILATLLVVSFFIITIILFISATFLCCCCIKYMKDTNEVLKRKKD